MKANNPSLSMITLPKACISCQHFTHKGTAEDKHCPFKASDAWAPKPTKTKYGNCSVCKADVFITEICPSYKAEPYIHVVAVANRPEPMQPRQTPLFL
ncbi:hypothetical protein P4S73_04810 [Paraglaciecola sp. Hal342]